MPEARKEDTRQLSCLWNRGGVCPTLMARDYKDPKKIVIKEARCVGGLSEQTWGSQYHQQDRVYTSDGLAMCHPANIPGGSYKYLVKEQSKDIIIAGKMDHTIDHTFESANRVYDPKGICPTIPTCGGGGIQPKVLVRVDIPQVVKCRKYEVEVPGLQKCLRESKQKAALSCKQIALALSIPQTKIEHYFRTDGSFAIPDADEWIRLKELLGIDTDEFDASIMEFEEKVGVFESAERHYLATGLSPTITGSNQFKIVAMRGRNPNNPKSRQAGLPTEQRLKARKDGCTNTLTTVQKDNLVVEKWGT